MMGNAPPQRFNYQQRVGRAGRRGKPFSLALCVARGNSHDQTHYVQSKRMVSSTPVDPYLDLERVEILMRVLNKQVLKLAFNSFELFDDEITDSIHGEFGKYHKWPNYRKNVQDWIIDHEPEIKGIIGYLRKGTFIADTEADIYQKLRDTLISSIDAVVNNTRDYDQLALSERLANAGHLPMFGFPTKIRFLYEKEATRLPPENAINRDLDIAISEFAPGSEVIKDKKVLVPVGLVTLDPDSNLLHEVLLFNLCMKSNQVPSDGIVHQINDNQGNMFRLGQIRNSERWVVGDLLSRRISLLHEDDYALVSSRHTGVITLSINKESKLYQLDGLNPYHRASFLSWAFLIRKAICDRLDIETNEFDVGFRVAPYSGKPEAYIVEKADNGAGYCNYLNGSTDRDIAEEIFIHFLSPDGRTYKEILMEPGHAARCVSSCYDCLRDYYNQQHHSFLNWRMALDVAALAKNEQATLDFSEAHWQRYLEDFVLKTLESKLSGKRDFIDGYHVIATNKNKYVLTHPFWGKQKLDDINSTIGDVVKPLNIMDAIAKTKY